MLTGNEAELVIEAVKVFVGAKNEQPRLVILELHKALVISKTDGIVMKKKNSKYKLEFETDIKSYDKFIEIIISKLNVNITK